MVELIKRERRSAVLTPSALPCLSRIAAVNLTAGCAHGCLYCYGKSYPCYPGDGRVVLYTNTLEKARRELARRSEKPTVVYFSPSSDLFQPVEEVLDTAYELLAFLLARRINVAFLTKGRIPDRHMALLCANASRVQAQIGVTTLDDDLRRMLEPGAAGPAHRLRQIERLCAAGIKLRARLDPLLPGWTDEPTALRQLCRALAGVGVRELSVSALFVRPQIVRSLTLGLPDGEALRELLRHYAPGAATRSAAGRAAERSLPRAHREHMYARVREIAAEFDLSVRVCGCENPDITSERCCIAGEWPDNKAGGQHMGLFGG